MSRAAHATLGCVLLIQLLSQTTEAAYYGVYVGSYSYYYYNSYSYNTYYYAPYVSIGAIVGSVIGALSFLASVIGIIICVCCVRRRRMAAARQAGQVTMVTIPPPIPVATVSGDGVHYPKQDGGAPVGYCAPPPPYPAYDAANVNGYNPAGGAYPMGPGAAMPYPQQPMMAYPPPSYQPRLQQQQAEQRF